jgi:hypothetical protein
MKKRLFAIPSLLAAGFLPVNAHAYPTRPTLDGELGKAKSLFDIFKMDHVYTLAGHRSHSSHSRRRYTDWQSATMSSAS